MRLLQIRPCTTRALGLGAVALLIICAASLGHSSVVQAGPDQLHVSTWDHNGSLMIMEQRGRRVEIRYEEVSQRMRRAGVRQGDILFDGRVSRRNRLSGEAYVFRRGCQPAGYDVSGRFEPFVGQDEVILRGAAPIRERRGCDVVDYSRHRKSGRLLFTLIGQDGHGGRVDDTEGQNDLEADVVTEGPGFNCQPYAKSGKCPEAMICSSGHLASQDLMMTRLYKDVLRLSRSASERNQQRQEQRESLKDRNACGCDFECLSEWYAIMNKSLGKTTVILGR